MSLDAKRAISIRLFSIVFALVTAVTLPQSFLLLVLVVLGQGHIFLAYLYKVEGGKMTREQYIVTFAILLAIIWLGFHIPLNLFGYLTAFGFLIHFSFDEARLLNGKNSIYTVLEMIPFILLYAAAGAEGYLGIYLFPQACALAGAVMALYLVLSIRNKRKPNATSYAFYCWILLALAFYLIATVYLHVGGVVWFWLLVTPHYFIWYGVYWYKLEKNPPQRNAYIVRTLAINVVLIVGAFFWLGGQLAPLVLILSPLAFDVWTILHEFSSVRPVEFRNSLRLNG